MLGSTAKSKLYDEIETAQISAGEWKLVRGSWVADYGPLCAKSDSYTTQNMTHSYDPVAAAISASNSMGYQSSKASLCGIKIFIYIEFLIVVIYFPSSIRFV